MIFMLIFVSLTVSSLAQDQIPQRRIIGGQLASRGQFPYQGVLSYLNGIPFCSVSIIHQRWALTAGHCAKKHLHPRITVGTNINDIYNRYAKNYDVAQFYVHDNFSVIPEELNNGVEYVAGDIALARIAIDIKFNFFVKPITLSMNDTFSYESSIAVISGWGSTRSSHHPMTKNMYYVNVKIVSQDECRKDWPYVKNDQLCTNNRGRNGVCNGDSGGPLVVNGIQVGIISSTDTYCQSLKYDLYTKVSSYIPWIREKMKRHNDDLQANSNIFYER